MTQITDDGDRAFTPYTAEKVDPLVDQAIAHLEGKIKQLMSLKGAEPKIATVIGRTHEVFGDLGVLWLVLHSQVLQAVPLDLISQGKTDPVLRLLIQIEHGVHVSPETKPVQKVVVGSPEWTAEFMDAAKQATSDAVEAHLRAGNPVYFTDDDGNCTARSS
jgi:hypothetical protein